MPRRRWSCRRLRWAEGVGRGDDRSLRANCPRARAAQRQALWQPYLRHSGHRQFQFDKGVLEAAAHRRCGSEGDVGPGAAQQWQVESASCTAANGTVTDAASGRTLAYGDLGGRPASALPVQPDPPKYPKNFTRQTAQALRHTEQSRRQLVICGIQRDAARNQNCDILPSARFGRKVGHVDDSAAKKIPGVRQIVLMTSSRSPAITWEPPSKVAMPLWSPGTKNPNVKVSSSEIPGKNRAPPRTVPSPIPSATPTKGCAGREIS